jgi:hypothetical protein
MRWSCLLIAGLLAGCTVHGTGSVTVAKDASTAPSGDVVPVAWTTVKLDDAKPLIRMAKAGETAQFSFKLKLPNADHSIYFGEIQNGDEQLVPIVGTRNGQQYRVVKLEKEWGYNQWRTVLSGPHPAELWGLLDQANDDQSGDTLTDEVAFVHSTDGGKTFQVGTLHKPCRKATVADLVMAKNGRGRITLSLGEDCGKLKAGLYHYRTSDGGKTFHSPQYEPDNTNPAEDVPDDEQPTQGTLSASAR